MAGLFKQIGRARRIPEKLAQYDDEYLLYCVEKDRVETVLERTLHETDDPNADPQWDGFLPAEQCWGCNSHPRGCKLIYKIIADSRC